MGDYPKVQKRLALTQDEGLRNTTIQFVSGALLSAGLLLGGNSLAESNSTVTPAITSQTSEGNAIILAPSSQMHTRGSMLLAGHYSHRSHASHASHHSHYSSR
jgi:hypothetical protein